MILSEAAKICSALKDNAAEDLSSENISIGSDSRSVFCQSNKLKLSFEVHIQNESMMAQQRCFIMTIHDIGSDYTLFSEFVKSDEMTDIRNRVVWLHVNLPGQETDASDLDLDKYPSFEEIAEELICVLEHFKVSQVVCMGEGAGSTICTHFAIRYPNKCLGLILVDPIASSASFIESVKFKLSNFNILQKSAITAQEKAYLFFNRFGKYGTVENEMFHLRNCDSEKRLCDNKNCKNLSLFAESFIKVDILIATGKLSYVFPEAKKFYKSIQDFYKKKPMKLVNCPFLEIDNATNLFAETPDRLATSLQYFLQGIGLLSALPMRNALKIRGSISSNRGSISMEEADQPRSTSQSDSSPLVSSNPSLILTD